jgi:hypothetical protein
MTGLPARIICYDTDPMLPHDMRAFGWNAQP